MLAVARTQTDWVSYYLFESPWLIIVGLALVWLVLRVSSRAKQDKTLSRVSWAPLLLIVALWVTSALVTTRREKLADTLEALLVAVEDEDTDTFRAIVPEDAEALFPPPPFAARFGRDGMEEQLKTFEVDDLLLLQSSYAVDGERALMQIVVRAKGAAGGIAGLQKFTWEITWRYVNDRWEPYAFACTKMGFELGNKKEEADAND
ncbi:MAG: hypothetical protein ACE37H_10365 [Phycisphaeraceae bacterium]